MFYKTHFSQWSGASVPLSISRTNRTPVTYEPQLKMVLECILCQSSISLEQGDTWSNALASHLAIEHKTPKDEAKTESRMMRSRIRPTTRRALAFPGASPRSSSQASSNSSSLTPLLSTPSSDSQYALVGRFLDPEIYQQY